MLSRIAWRFLFSGQFKAYGRKAHIFSPDYIVGEEYVAIGDDVYIGNAASIIVLREGLVEQSVTIGAGKKIRRLFHVVCIGEITIGENVLIADEVLIAANIHVYADVEKPIIFQPLAQLSRVEVGDGACIGENVCIVGAKVGKNTTIGANSVVVTDIPDYAVAV
jgi:acetyltransferase-like isoleucine patch superfamily enzyme